MVLEIIIIKFSCILKMMSRNTFPEPQPDSASYYGPFNQIRCTIFATTFSLKEGVSYNVHL